MDFAGPTSYGLATDTVTAMLKSALGNVEEDAAARMLREAELDARRLLDATDAALREDGERLLQPREQFQILCSMQAVADLLEQCAQGEGNTAQEQQALRNALQQAADGLNRGTTPFAERRMNARVREALGGRRVDQLAA